MRAWKLRRLRGLAKQTYRQDCTSQRVGLDPTWSSEIARAWKGWGQEDPQIHALGANLQPDRDPDLLPVFGAVLLLSSAFALRLRKIAGALCSEVLAATSPLLDL